MPIMTWKRAWLSLVFGLVFFAAPNLKAQDEVPPPPSGADLGMGGGGEGGAAPAEPQAPAPSEPSAPGGEVPNLPADPGEGKSAPLPESSTIESFGIPEEPEPAAEPQEAGPEETRPGEAAVKPGAVPAEYQIQPGDTLWDICQKLLDNPWYWPKLWSLNDYILNPHLIYPGNRLAFFSGSETAPPRLEILDENAQKPLKSFESPTIKEAAEAPPSAALEAPAGTGTGGIVDVGKKKVSVRLKALAFLSEKDFETAGEVSHSGESKMELWTGDRVYLAFSKKRRVSVNDKFTVIEKVKKVKDPDSMFGSFGVLVRKKAVIKVIAIRKNTVEGIILECEDGTRRGNKIIPYVSPIRTVTMHTTTRPIDGKIIESENQSYLIGNNDFVFLNLGKKHGVDDGLRLVVVRRGDGIFQGEDEKLPYVPVAHMVVVETGDTTSTAYVTSERDSLSVGDQVRNEIE